VLFAAAAALIIAEKAKDLKDGVRIAAAAIDDGRARVALERMVAVSNEPPPRAATGE
jgi:anthranilate phosphoribosyltransferase